ncbi:WD40-repeat-containing domain protein [Chytriomyces cf. hyalinus JEL632]|nr:WD40-repeat-containing domain protein [Chytriomyces cf. hyalinus JEL632]
MDLSAFGLPTGFGGSRKTGATNTKSFKPAWAEEDDEDDKPKLQKLQLSQISETAHTHTELGSKQPSIQTANIARKKGLHAELHPSMRVVAETALSNSNSDSIEDDAVDGPMPPSKERIDDGDNSESESEEEEEEEEEVDWDVLPVTSQIKLADHRRTVSALSLDPSGSRLVSGGRDCTVKLWDFNGMNEMFRPFRSIDEPCGGNPIRDLQYSNSGDQFLIASGSNQAKLYDREGSSIAEYMKGDMYLRDMKNTKGHISALTCCKWHPTDRSTFLTASLDSTIRIWNIENKRENKAVIAVKSKDKGGRTPITAATYSPDGKIIAGMGQDGEFRLWDSNGPFIRPTHSIEGAHMSNSVTSSISISLDNLSLITRSNDDTLKLWDIRAFKKPVAIAKDLPSFYEESNAIFSPNNKLVVTGISVKKEDRGGHGGNLCIFNKADLSPVTRVDVGPGSVVKVLWNGKINQICASTTEGAVHVLYDENVSAAGAKFCAKKKAKAKTVDDMSFLEDESARVIINPHALPMYREENPLFNRGGGKRKTSKLRNDAVATRKPDRPLTGPGRGGKVGTSLTNHIMKNLMKDTMRDEDPREAILKHADAAASDPFWIAPAYQKTQPKTVMADSVYEDENEEDRASKKKRPN